MMPITLAPSRRAFLVAAGQCVAALACSDAGSAPAAASPSGPTPGPASPAAPTWSVRKNGSILEIAFGAGTSFPQDAALHTESGYLRMVSGPDSGWGTSVVILPSFWAGRYFQGAPTTVTWRTEGTTLVLPFSASISTLSVEGQIRLDPPAGDALTATVTATTSGTVALDSRPDERFKPMMLSSMHVSGNLWDAESMFVGSRSMAIPADGWIVKPPVTGSLLGLAGGTSGWKVRAPSVEIALDRDYPITGWVTVSNDPNSDNIASWPAANEVMGAWQDRIRAFKR